MQSLQMMVKTQQRTCMSAPERSKEFGSWAPTNSGRCFMSARCTARMRTMEATQKTRSLTTHPWTRNHYFSPSLASFSPVPDDPTNQPNERTEPKKCASLFSSKTSPARSSPPAGGAAAGIAGQQHDSTTSMTTTTIALELGEEACIAQRNRRGHD